MEKLRVCNHKKAMPEAPEVKTVTRQLNERLAGRILSQLTFLTDKHSFQIPLGSCLKQIRNRGKSIVFEWNYLDIKSNTRFSFYLYSGLGMTGTWTLNQRAHCHFYMVFDDGDDAIYFCDARPFGKSHIEQGLDSLNKLAPPIIQGYNDDIKSIDLESFVKSCQQRKGAIASALLDQHLICSGIGAYIITEALYLSRIHPKAISSTLPIQVLSYLYTILVSICERSYTARGNSFRDYIDIYEDPGEYQSQLLIYGKRNDSYGYEIEKVSVGGRSISFCPKQIVYS